MTKRKSSHQKVNKMEIQAYDGVETQELLSNNKIESIMIDRNMKIYSKTLIVVKTHKIRDILAESEVKNVGNGVKQGINIQCQCM